MTYTRQNVWELGGDWADPILWYARGVKAMKARKLNEPTGWQFYGAIHGINHELWTELGYLSPTDPMPSAADIATFWDQCQHGSWYFEPWHRGYLIAFETIIRDAVVRLGGPADWALPYWNYFKTNQNALPPAFGSPNWPDGQGDNPLFVEQRYGPGNDGDVYVPMNWVNLDALGDPDFTGVSSGSPGFGGLDTGFSHGGDTHGGIETQPHDYVHGLVGGGDPKNPNMPGLMSDPDTAALDPIFWLHHANIDRLWETWRQNPTSHVDPTEPNWVNGPASIGERAFIMPMPGGASWTYTPGEMSDLSGLDYVYDDISPPAAAPKFAARLQRLGVGAEAAEALEGTIAMAAPRNVELLGANEERMSLSGTEARTSVRLDAAVQRKVSASLVAAAAEEPVVPDRIFLNLENVRGRSDATTFRVYINLPEGENPDEHPERLAGSIALFGVRKASLADGEQGGDGLTFVLEITRIVDALHLEDSLATRPLDVRLVPVNPVPDSAQISIGRISVFRQGS